MLYYIEACLLRSPYFVTFAALKAGTVQSALEPSSCFSQIRSHMPHTCDMLGFVVVLPSV